MEQVIVDTFDSLRDYIPRLTRTAENMAETLQSGNHQEAIHQLPAFFEGVEWVVQALNGLSKNGYYIDVKTSLLNEYLIETEKAIRNQDVILLADLLEYEIVPILTEWLKKCTPLAE